MTHLRPTVSDTLLNVQVHDHVCLLYETPEEQFQTALPFLKAGLDKQDYCIYVADENTTQTVMERMRRENLDVDTAVASGRLALLTKRESFLRNGAFHADQMIEFLKEGCGQAKARGFSACRGTGEMTCAERPPYAESLVLYAMHSVNAQVAHHLQAEPDETSARRGIVLMTDLQVEIAAV